MWNTIKASALVKLARWHASFLCPCTEQKVGDWLMPGCPYQFNLHLQSFGKVYPGCQRPPLKQPTRGKVHTVSGKRWPGRAERRAKRVPWLPSRGIVWNKKKITPSFGYLFVKHLQRRRKKAPKFKVLLNLNKVYHNCCSALCLNCWCKCCVGIFVARCLLLQQFYYQYTSERQTAPSVHLPCALVDVMVGMNIPAGQWSHIIPTHSVYTLYRMQSLKFNSMKVKQCWNTAFNAQGFGCQGL